CTKTNETGKFLHTESLKVHLSNSRTPLYPYSWEIYLLTAFVIFSSRIQDKFKMSQSRLCGNFFGSLKIDVSHSLNP
ncbi:hypothetical protein, partial [Heyndrickxia coagulans]|uniref:hypothetical protein n=1 Tax=Heyndrickxia coagulans TaxID=1398 RepID=UPI001F40093E